MLRKHLTRRPVTMPDVQKARFRWSFIPITGMLRFDEQDVVKITRPDGSRIHVGEMGTAIADALNSVQDSQIREVTERFLQE
jgi:hypothetical protein